MHYFVTIVWNFLAVVDTMVLYSMLEVLKRCYRILEYHEDFNIDNQLRYWYIYKERALDKHHKEIL